MRVAFVHDWLTTYGGSERVLEQMLQVFPGADVFTLIDNLPADQRAWLDGSRISTSFLQRIPGQRRNYRNLLPLMPLAVEQFDLSGYELVISSSHAVAKGVLTGPDQLHVSMCYSPIRYAWDLQHQYLRSAGYERGVRGALVRSALHYVRIWDARTSHGVDEFIAISKFIARRIKKVYGRDSTVIYPPVDTEGFPLSRDKGDVYVTASRLVPYKRVDLIAAAFSRMPDRQLVIIGDGPERAKVEAVAGPNVHVIGHQPHSVLKDHIGRARAFVFAAEEDFGIAPVEAMATGTPVIAYGRGGALETVTERETGMFFDEQSAESLIEAVAGFEAMRGEFDPVTISQHAQSFGKERFRREFQGFVLSALERFAGSQDRR